MSRPVCHTCGRPHDNTVEGIQHRVKQRGYAPPRPEAIGGHRDALGLFCSPTCAMAFAVAAVGAGVRLDRYRPVTMRNLRDLMFCRALQGCAVVTISETFEDIPS